MQASKNATRILIALYILLQTTVALYCLPDWTWATLADRLYYLDSFWYVHIAKHGYTASPLVADSADKVFAFFPLWPLLLRGLSKLVPVWLPLQLAGSMLALSLYGYWLCSVQRSSDNVELPNWLQPSTRFGLFFAVFTPAAWVFASNHTEALFLLLSYTAFRSAWQRRIILAAVCAGLAALTRNQGALVCISVILLLWQRQAPVKRIALCSAIIFCIASLWPGWQWLQTGDALHSSVAQKHWYMAPSLGAYVSNFLWFSPNNAWRSLLMWSCFITAFYWLRTAPDKYAAPAIYVLLSAMLWPLQGNNLPQAYRFGAVLFPLWFVWGDAIARLVQQKARSPRAAEITLGVLMLVVVMHAGIRASYYYLQTSWPY